MTDEQLQAIKVSTELYAIIFSESYKQGMKLKLSVPVAVEMAKTVLTNFMFRKPDTKESDVSALIARMSPGGQA